MSALKKTLINEVAEQLKANPRKRRFLTELQDHLEDAERTDALGEVLVVSNAFNKYAVAHARLVFYRTIIFAFVVAIWSAGGMMTVIFNNGEITSPMALLAIPGWLLSLPIITPGYLLALYILQPYSSLQAATPYLFIVAVFLITIFWTTVAYMLQSNPPKFLQKFGGKSPDRQSK